MVMKGDRRLRDYITWIGFDVVSDMVRSCPVSDTILYSLPPTPLVLLQSRSMFLRLALYFKLLKQRVGLFEELSHSETQNENMTRTSASDNFYISI